MAASAALAQADINKKIENSSGENQYLTFILDGEEYGVDILRVQEIKGWDSVTPLPNVPKYIKGVMNLRGTIVPVVCLRKRFGMKDSVQRYAEVFEFDPSVVESSFQIVASRGADLVHGFYNRLFERHPEVRKLFSASSHEDQERKLLTAMKTVVANLRQPAAMKKIMKSFGEKHQKYGATAQHYPIVTELLIESMRDVAGDQWQEAYAVAWRNALKTISQMMLSAYREEEVNKTVVVVLRVESKDRARTIGVVVDAVSDVYSIGANQICPPPSFGGGVTVECVAGMATLDEKMVIMLDIDGIIEFGEA